MNEAKNYTDEELQNLKRVQLEIFDEVVGLCERHNIEYVAVAGTVLGAVRHNGYIPWDDDLDIAMIRDDYDRFLKIAEKELGDRFFLQNYDTEKNSIAYFSKIRKNGTLFVQDADLNTTAHKGIFIDVFPFDNLPDSRFKKKIFRFVQIILYQIFIAKSTVGMMGTNNSFKGKCKQMARTILHIVAIPISKGYLYNELDKLLRKYNGVDTESVMQSPEFARNGLVFPKKWIFPTVKEEFEGRLINVPCEKNKYLELRYGKDFMQLPPKSKRFNHRPIKLFFEK